MNKPQQKEKLRGPILALDLGQKRIGVAVSDELLISITRLNSLRRSSWKQLLQHVCALIRSFDAHTLVIGLPLRLNGTSGSAALDAWRTAEKFALSLQIPVFLQDERLTSAEAEQHLRAEGHKPREISALVDSESAAIILRDFLTGGQERILVRAEIAVTP
jgi:putative holliday junction resolvase